MTSASSTDSFQSLSRLASWPRSPAPSSLMEEHGVRLGGCQGRPSASNVRGGSIACGGQRRARAGAVGTIRHASRTPEPAIAGLDAGANDAHTGPDRSRRNSPRSCRPPVARLPVSCRIRLPVAAPRWSRRPGGDSQRAEASSIVPPSSWQRVYRLVNLNAAGRAAVLDRLRARLFDTVGSPNGPSFSSEERGLRDRAAALVATLVDCPQ